MTIAEKIHRHVMTLPEPRQVQVLDFVEFLLLKSETDLEDRIQELDDQEWSQFSLKMAIRGMEDEEDLYSIEDLKETF